MASFSRTSQSNGPWPHKTIGCQQLLSTEDVAHSGALKKQLSHNKYHSIGTVVRMLPWVNRYVVLSAGSLYHYTEPFAKKPNGAYTLFGYNQVVRAGDIPSSKYPWAFKIVHVTENKKNKYFCAGSEKELKTWMREIRSQLVIANGSLISDTNLNMKVSDEDVEKPIYDSSDELAEQVVRKKRNTDKDSDSDGDDYLEIDENTLSYQEPGRPMSRPLPSIPAEQKPSKPLVHSRPDEPVQILNLMNNNGYGDDDFDLADSVVKSKPLSAPPKSHLHDRAPFPIPIDQNTTGKQPSKSRSFREMPFPLPPSLNRNLSTPEAAESPPPKKPQAAKKPIGVKVFPGGGGMTNPLLVKPMKKNPRSTGLSMEEEPQSPIRSPVDKLPVAPTRMRNIPVSPSPCSSPVRSDSESCYEDEWPQPGRSDNKNIDTENLIRWSDVYWDGADKQACEQIIRNIGIDGVYMVRESDRAGCVKTLVCYAEDQARKFMIKQSDEGSYYLKDSWCFPSIIALLEHYHHNNLPNRNTKLLEPFTKHTLDSR